jgi:hypothetical protein
MDGPLSRRLFEGIARPEQRPDSLVPEGSGDTSSGLPHSSKTRNYDSRFPIDRLSLHFDFQTESFQSLVLRSNLRISPMLSI